MRRRRGSAGSKGSAGSNGSAPGRASSTEPSRRGFRPATDGPKVRFGILWFFLALAAVTAGRGPAAALWGIVGAAAAWELLGVWWPGGSGSGSAGRSGSAPDAPDGAPFGLSVLAAAVVLSVAAAAAFGTGIAGAALVVVAASLGVAVAMAGSTRRSSAGSSSALDRGEVTALSVAVLLPAMTVAAVVLVVGAHLWTGLFLVMAVSLYDAGFFVGGADSVSSIEGPVTGIVGVLAVTFTMAMFQAPPFDAASAAVVGVACAAACPAGQWITTRCLPAPDAPARALRRLDAYVLSAPVFLVAAWAL